jgi:hypothetical protein
MTLYYDKIAWSQLHNQASVHLDYLKTRYQHACQKNLKS